MKNRNSILIGGALLVLASFAIACGPYFPQAFLPHRNALLKAPIEGDFAFELGRYSKAIRSASSAPQLSTAESAVARRNNAEAKGVTSDRHRLIQRMRQAKDGDEAYAIGIGLPEEIRLYTAAAVDYQLAKGNACQTSQGTVAHSGNSDCNSNRCDGFDCDFLTPLLLPANPVIARALLRFEAVLTLPQNERRQRATWAAYALAESHLNYLLPDRRNKAYNYYALVRRLARSGYPDPLDLAQSSLGQEAFLRLDAGDTGSAVSLYLEQGDVNSLRFVAEKLLSQPSKLSTELKSRPVRRLLVAYAFSHGHASPYSGKQPSWMQPTVKALIASGAGDIENIDRLGALSYQAGKYADAAQLVATSETPLAHWLKSKLARRSGDKTLAAEHLMLAGADQSALRKSLPADLAKRLAIENVTVSLDQGETVKAIGALYSMGPNLWPDTAYVAERLLTTKELRAFVDALPSGARQNATSTARSAPLAMTSDDTLEARFGYRSTGRYPDNTEPLDSANQIRLLLARRLMREGRYKSALTYFPASEPQIIDHAKEYAAAVHASKSTKTTIDKAEALFRVGYLARKHGLEVLGHELAPDFYYAYGNYWADSVIGLKRSTGSSARVYRRSSMSEEEGQRFDATAPRIDKRYHYRYLAVEKAREAARLVPSRSQAYRAILCHGASWSPDSELASDLYKIYLRNGSHMNYPLARLFGRRCEPPDFEGARRMNAAIKAKAKDRIKPVMPAAKQGATK